ncbi:LysE family translocator [Asaia sp. As-1742]|uniref:LysE family translocator n=1 Tax=Asaia sp. As-1742 TaxID=2608325 RepID=UPI00141D75C7|nr:LysE family translocator [Asaia sp. As-1742]NIE79300.1 LysE family translocator [Asaia sp. As-1742]
MTLQTWWLFVVTVFFISATPGPNMMHALGRSVQVGFRRSLAAMAGCITALLLALVLSVMGIGAILIAMPRLFDIIRYAGAGYLIFLGIKAWRASDSPDPPGETSGAPLHVSRWALYRTGFLVGISNPKLLLFAAAFFPQFIDHHQPVLPQFGILVVTYLFSDGLWLTLYGLGGRSLSRFLSRRPVRRAFNRLTAIVFVAFGIVILRAKA